MPIDLQATTLTDGRAAAATLDAHGFALVGHSSAVSGFDDPRSAVCGDEVIELVRGVSGADMVAVTSPGVLRFGERHDKSGALDNSRPARFAHVDVNDATARAFAQRSRTVRR